MTHREQAERRRAIAEYVRQTKCTGKEAAKAFGVTHPTVYIACREHAVQTKRLQLPKEAATARLRKIAEYIRETGCTVAEAAKAFGVSRQTAYIACRDHGVQSKQRQQQRKKLASRRQEIAEHILANNCTVAETAITFGVSRYAVYIACRKHGVKLADKLEPNTLKVLADLFDSTVTIAEIADRHGVTQQRVSQVFVQALKAGIPIPRPTKSPELASRNGTRAEVTA